MQSDDDIRAHVIKYVKNLPVTCWETYLRYTNCLTLSFYRDRFEMESLPKQQLWKFSVDGEEPTITTHLSENHGGASLVHSSINILVHQTKTSLNRTSCRGWDQAETFAVGQCITKVAILVAL